MTQLHGVTRKPNLFINIGDIYRLMKSWIGNFLVIVSKRGLNREFFYEDRE
jgi:hypothetical protein